eukprot:1011585-Rhodomonas_salina.1
MTSWSVSTCSHRGACRRLDDHFQNDLHGKVFDVAIPEHATQVTLGCIGEGLTQHEAIETLRGKRESLTFWMREATDVREAMESTAQ